MLAVERLVVVPEMAFEAMQKFHLVSQVLERRVQPAQCVGAVAQLRLGGLLQRDQSALRLAAAVLEQRV